MGLPILSPKTHLNLLARRVGAVACGVAVAAPVDSENQRIFSDWIGRACHGEMKYLENHRDIRFDPRLLLPGAKSIISLAFSYRQPDGFHHPHIADYALGRDYHYVLKDRLAPLCKWLAGMGASSKVCVDSAPILERYWAAKAGIGFIGLNRQLIVPGVGSQVFLAEVITTFEFAPDTPLDFSCAKCGRCVRECPAKALNHGFDARICRSYLTIEHRGPLPDNAPIGSAVAGCDICQTVCLHNFNSSTSAIDEFLADEQIKSLTLSNLSDMTGGQWKRLTRGSALSRIPIGQLRRNLSAHHPDKT